MSTQLQEGEPHSSAFLRRNLSTCAQEASATCYKSLVKAQLLKQASTVWYSSTKSNISQVEVVHRMAARFVTGDYRWTSSLITMLQHLGWVERLTRRQHDKATMMYRSVPQLVEIPTAQYFHHTGTQTIGHTSRFLQTFTTVNRYRDFFIYPASDFLLLM